MPDRLLLAEAVFDLQTATYDFRGNQSETTTGRVLLHAMNTAGGAEAAGRALCCRAADGLALLDRDWDARYLPHLPRCLPCTTATASGSQSGLQLLGQDDLAAPPAGQPVTGVDIRTAHGTEAELRGADALRSALAGHDLRRFLMTDLVTVDEQIRGGFSHPLTLNPRTLESGPQAALSTFLHEQMHWVYGPGLAAATTEVAGIWPDPPPPPAGSYDSESSWLHISVCSLEYVSLAEVIGEAEAVAVLSEHVYYSWMYEQILADTAWARDLLTRHGLGVPAAPPVPRRYCGPDWWVSIPGVLRSQDQEMT